jgi:hypothetical protein
MDRRISSGRCLTKAVSPAADAGWLAGVSLLVSAMWLVFPGTQNRLFSIACLVVLLGAMGAAIAVQVLVKRELARLLEQGFLVRARLRLGRWVGWAAIAQTMVAVLMTAIRARHDFADTVLTLCVSLFLTLLLWRLWLVIRWIWHAQIAASAPDEPART